jgi:chromosomal replication initiation ATPase DnaA
MEKAQDLIEQAAETWYTTPAEILSSSRTANLVAARRQIARELRKQGWSYPMIGRALHRHHTNIMYLVNRNDGWIHLTSDNGSSTM